MNHFLVRLSLFVIVFFALLEGVNVIYTAWTVRSRTAKEYEPRVRAPYLEFQAPANWRSADLSTNSEGFRYQEITKDKEPGLVRIFVLGASIVFDGTSNETTISGFLERRMREAYPLARIQVINAGSTSYNSTQSALMYFLKVLDYSPDMILFIGGKYDFFVAQEIERRPGYTHNFATQEDHEEVIRRLWDVPLPTFLLNHYAFIGDINPSLSRKGLLEKFASRGHTARHFATLAEFEPYIDKVGENVRKMMLLSKALAIPGFYFLEPRHEYSGLEGQAFERLQRHLGSLARDYPDQHVYDLKYLEDRLTFHGGFHWNREQNVLLAEEIFAIVRPALEQRLGRAPRPVLSSASPARTDDTSRAR